MVENSKIFFMTQVETFVRTKSVISAFLRFLWFAVKQASFVYWLFGTGWAEKHSSFDEYSIIARCVGPDPGYITTSACVLVSALLLLNDADKLPQGHWYMQRRLFFVYKIP
ncbi:unnamed protein product [Onchocerca flexuosa]|uniref:Bestrophin homolog n=1 Tax=Onchocerca flexuosa TaxID=387005 RepID=A0A183I660_9BILA|nr:unnamed protein product [Onchocerca flexuosa]